jgi:chromosome segregation ATPase
MLLPFTAQRIEAADAQDKPGLNEEELQELQSTLAELKSLGPKLRIQLRTVRRQVGFDPREIYKIERAMGQSEKDLERLIAMQQRNAFKKMRAHFMVDDLRRKSESLNGLLGYVKQLIQQLDQAPGGRQADAQLKQNDDALLELLGLYSDLISASVMMLKDKEF